jgi:hypothetical protein
VKVSRRRRRAANCFPFAQMSTPVPNWSSITAHPICALASITTTSRDSFTASKRRLVGARASVIHETTDLCLSSF